jgi:hypothetical protein
MFGLKIKLKIIIHYFTGCSKLHFIAALPNQKRLGGC